VVAIALDVVRLSEAREKRPASAARVNGEGMLDDVTRPGRDHLAGARRDRGGDTDVQLTGGLDLDLDAIGVGRAEQDAGARSAERGGGHDRDRAMSHHRPPFSSRAIRVRIAWYPSTRWVWSGFRASMRFRATQFQHAAVTSLAPRRSGSAGAQRQRRRQPSAVGPERGYAR